MWKDRVSKHYLVGFICAFFAFVLIRHGTYLIEAVHDRQYYFYMISQIGCILIVSCWMLTVQSRIVDYKVRRLMLLSGGLFILYFLMQMTKYCLFAQNPDVGRYMWYGYYVPMTMIPLMIVYILRYLSLPREQPFGKWKILLIPALLICIGFLTNDIHQLAFGIPNWEISREKERTLGPIYYIYIAYMVVLFGLGVYCAFRMRNNVKNKKKLLYPCIPLLIGIIYFVIYTVKPDLVKINKHKFLEIGESFAFMMISFLEVMIQIGLIPSYVGYRKFFLLTGIPARVVDNNGVMSFSTMGAANMPDESEDYHIVETSITGGKFYYGIDMRELNRLNKELNDATAVLEARNNILRHENDIIREREQSEAAIRIYDHISDIIRPQILEIHELLSDDNEEAFRENLIRIAVLNAYVKRRSNMELEAQKEGILLFAELVMATSESLEYFKLSGAETYISYSGEGKCISSRIVQAYSIIGRVLEKVLGTVDYLTIHISLDEKICIRFLVNGKNIPNDYSSALSRGWRMECIEEENDTELLFCEEKGGDEL